MTADIVTSTAFGLTDDKLDELRKQGVVVSDNLPAPTNLPEPEYGEEIIGELTGNEMELFVQLRAVTEQLEDLGRTTMGQAIAAAGDAIARSDRKRTLVDLAQSGDIAIDFMDEDARMEYCTLEARVAVLHATLYWTIGSRLNAHNYHLGVRSKGRVVKTRKRYESKG